MELSCAECAKRVVVCQNKAHFEKDYRMKHVEKIKDSGWVFCLPLNCTRYRRRIGLDSKKINRKKEE